MIREDTCIVERYTCKPKGTEKTKLCNHGMNNQVQQLKKKTSESFKRLPFEEEIEGIAYKPIIQSFVILEF